MNLAEIAARYDKLTILRLVRSLGILESDHRELLERPEVASALGTLKRMRGPALARWASMPDLEAWVGRFEYFLRMGLPGRYPTAHPLRHLRELSALLLAAGEDLEPESHGRVEGLGRARIPLRYGQAYLMPLQAPLTTDILWERKPTGISLADPAGGEVLLLSFEEPHRVRVDDESWAFHRASRWRETILDLPFPACEEVQAFLEAGEREGGEAVKEAFALGLRRVEAPPEGADDPEASAAGVVSWPPAAEGRRTWKSLLDLALGDLILRQARLCRFDGGSLGLSQEGLDEFSKLAAEHWRRKMLGEPSEVGDSPPLVRSCRALARSGAGGKLLAGLGLPVEKNEAQVVYSGGDGEILDLDGQALESLSPYLEGRSLSLRKTRPGSLPVGDWSALDKLAKIEPSVLEAGLEELEEGLIGDEASFYLQAILCYVLGDFERCLQALEGCRGFDDEAEEYRYLEAFALRHRGDFQSFEARVFGGEDP